MAHRDVSDLRLHDLRTLSVLLRERNLTRAAELLDTTQPSISKILKRLRDHFGDPLVIRNGRAMQLTPRAAEMTEQLRSLLVASDGLCAATPAFDPRKSERAFRLLVTDVGTIVFLPALLSRVASDGGRITLRAVPLDSRHFALRITSSSWRQMSGMRRIMWPNMRWRLKSPRRVFCSVCRASLPLRLLRLEPTELQLYRRMSLCTWPSSWG
jgi:DNA-binding transcriptional LysR family regulator